MKSLLLRSNSAIATIEFALVAPIVLMVLCLALESARLQMASLLIQRSMYDLAYRAKTDQNRGATFQDTAKKALEKRSGSIFFVDEITVKVNSDRDMRNIRPDGGEPTPGYGQDIVRLTYEAELGLFPNLMPDKLKVKRTFYYYYINEPEGQI
ncbi:MAG: pilus assembly protein [Deltaproteobacteria bacterium]|jgi:hypothetical protein|nr:pilus assembly protein [Deltaproteobacteria bacterium]